MINFDVKFLKEVDTFLEVIEPKARAKITNDPSIFKKLKGTEIWEFRARFKRNAI